MNLRIAVVACAVLLAGCALAAEKQSRHGTVKTPVVQPRADAKPVAAEDHVSPPAPGTEPVTPKAAPTGEAPVALVEKMRADLLQRLAAEKIADAPVVISSEEIVWPDGGMGCGRPGEMYTMNLIPGYRVVFGVGSRRFAYHASRAGAFKYCGGAPLRVAPPSAGRENPAT